MNLKHAASAFELTVKVVTTAMGFIELLQLMIKLAPVIAEAIKAAEAVIGGGAGTGPVKKALVKDMVANSVALSPKAVDHPITNLPADLQASMLDRIVDGVVSGLKTAGKL